MLQQFFKLAVLCSTAFAVPQNGRELRDTCLSGVWWSWALRTTHGSSQRSDIQSGGASAGGYGENKKRWAYYIWTWNFTHDGHSRTWSGRWSSSGHGDALRLLTSTRVTGEENNITEEIVGKLSRYPITYDTNLPEAARKAFNHAVLERAGKFSCKPTLRI